MLRLSEQDDLAQECLSRAFAKLNKINVDFITQRNHTDVRLEEHPLVFLSGSKLHKVTERQIQENSEYQECLTRLEAIGKTVSEIQCYKASNDEIGTGPRVHVSFEDLACD